MARQISAVVQIADDRKMAPEEVASNQQNFDSYWRIEQAKLEDMCRQYGRKPNFFATIAPAEWNIQWHRGVQHWRKATGAHNINKTLI